MASYLRAALLILIGDKYQTFQTDNRLASTDTRTQSYFLFSTLEPGRADLEIVWSGPGRDESLKIVTSRAGRGREFGKMMGRAGLGREKLKM